MSLRTAEELLLDMGPRTRATTPSGSRSRHPACASYISSGPSQPVVGWLTGCWYSYAEDAWVGSYAMSNGSEYWFRVGDPYVRIR